MFKLQFETANAAFEDQPARHIAAILATIGNRVCSGAEGGPIHDYNGNRIGSWSYEPAETAEDE